MDRQTKKITLPVTKTEAVIYTYITGGEKRKINEVLTENISADLSGEAKGEIPLSLVYKTNDLALELLVVELDNSADDKITRISNLPERDYNFLLEEVNKVTQDSDFLAEKKT